MQAKVCHPKCNEGSNESLAGGPVKKLNTCALSIMVNISCLLFSCAVFYPVAANCASAAGQDQGSAVTGDQNTAIDPEALAILKKATDYLTGLKQVRFTGYKEEDAVQESGQKLQFSSSFEVCLKRPDRLFITRTDDNGIAKRFCYDGKTATTYDEAEKVYGQIKVPDTIDVMLDYLETVMEAPRPLADLLYNDLSYLAERARAGSYVDISIFQNIPCDHLAFRGESLDWQFWIDRGEKPLIRKVVITYKALPGEPQLSARLEEWNVSPELSESLFHFSPPEGSRRIQIVGSKRTDSKQGGAQ
jgi:hypothetical protein